MTTEEIDNIFAKVGEAVTSLPRERLVGFTYRADRAVQTIGNENVVATISPN